MLFYNKKKIQKSILLILILLIFTIQIVIAKEYSSIKYEIKDSPILIDKDNLMSKELITINKEIKISIKDSNNIDKILTNSLLKIKDKEYTYESILENIDIKYEIKQNSIKETIIINSKPKYKQLKFKIDLGNKYYSFENNKINVWDDNEFGFFSQPFIEETGELIPISFDGENYIIYLEDIDWNKLTFPVIIDPTYEDIQGGILAYFSFNNYSNIYYSNVNGYNHTAQLYNTDSSNLVSGKVSNSIYLDNVNELINISTTEQKKLDAYKTMCFWFKSNNLANTDYIYRSMSSNSLSSVYLKANGEIAQIQNTYSNSDDSNFEENLDDDWHLYCMEIHDSLQSKYYIDGKLNFTGSSGTGNLYDGPGSDRMDWIEISSYLNSDISNITIDEFFIYGGQIGASYVDWLYNDGYARNLFNESGLGDIEINAASIIGLNTSGYPIESYGLATYCNGDYYINATAQSNYYDYIVYKNNNLYLNGTTAFNSTGLTNIVNLTSGDTARNDIFIFSCRTNYNNENYTYWINSSSYTLTLYDYGVDECNNSFGTNSNATMITFVGLYENNLSKINISAMGSFTWNWIDSSVTNTIYPSYINKQNFSYCGYPNYTSFEVSYDFQYNPYGIDLTRSRSDTITINSIETIVPLYNLISDNAEQIKFRIFDTYNNPLSGVTVSATRNILGTPYIVTSSLSDSAGMVYIYLDTTQTYSITASKTGYTSSSISIKPTAIDIYTITLGTQLDLNKSYAAGILYNFLPVKQDLNNGTNYTFSFNISSTFWNLSSCNLLLKTQDNNLVSKSGLSTGTLCQVNINWNTGNYTNITSYASYSLNGTNFNVEYNYYPTTWEPGQYSLLTIIQDIQRFSKSGFNSKTRLLIALFAILGITFGVAYKFNSLINPEALLLLQWALVLFFSIIGFLRIESSIISFPIIAGNTLDMANYAIFVLDSLITSMYLLWRHN